MLVNASLFWFLVMPVLGDISRCPASSRRFSRRARSISVGRWPVSAAILWVIARRSAVLYTSNAASRYAASWTLLSTRRLSTWVGLLGAGMIPASAMIFRTCRDGSTILLRTK